MDNQSVIHGLSFMLFHGLSYLNLVIFKHEEYTTEKEGKVSSEIVKEEEWQRRWW
ncbi:hypothetical protein ccbrp13_39830 [Ktedonobacteria bacterium brp13]|nr:hypothetical protein ccbrp13_39830 [Ktedonobacteria bacterium brp13]